MGAVLHMYGIPYSERNRFFVVVAWLVGWGFNPIARLSSDPTLSLDHTVWFPVCQQPFSTSQPGVPMRRQLQ